MEIKIPVNLVPEFNAFVEENKADDLIKLGVAVASRKITQEDYDNYVAQINVLTSDKYLLNVLKSAIINWKKTKLSKIKNKEIRDEIKSYSRSLEHDS